VSNCLPRSLLMVALNRSLRERRRKASPSGCRSPCVQAGPWLQGGDPRVRCRLKLFSVEASALLVSPSDGSVFLGIHRSAWSRSCSLRACPGLQGAGCTRSPESLDWGRFSAAGTVLFSLVPRTEGAQYNFPFHLLCCSIYTVQETSCP